MTKCARCGRNIKYPVKVGNKFYGSSCAKWMQPTDIESLKTEIAFLRSQIIDLQRKVQTNRVNDWPALPTVPGNGDNKLPIGIGYGGNHTDLMDELRAVLKPIN